MSNEATIRSGLTIRQSSLFNYNQPGFGLFQASLTTPIKGPCPGLITIPVGGIAVTFPYLTTPGLCFLKNLSSSNFVEIGIRDPVTNKFYPLDELLPGEEYVKRFSRNLLEYYSGTGTGTSAGINYLWFKANTAPCDVIVDAFEK